VIELKRGEVAEIVLNNLYKLTPMQETFGMNMVALVDGQPKLLNLKQFFEAFLRHRREVVTRRTVFDLRKARDRGHILEGLAVALSNVDEVIAIIKAAATPAAAKTELMGRTWRSPLVEQMLSRASAEQFRPEALPKEFGKTDAQLALTITITLAFRPVGAFIFGLMADRYGRKLPLMIDLVFFSIVEVASGQTADRFLKTRIFDPLGMKDTGFRPPTGNPRLVSLYQRSPDGTLRPQPEAAFQNGIYFSGGGGLYSTAQDYFQFAQMLLAGGQSHGKRLLSDRTVALMRSPFAPDTLPGRLAGEGYALSVRVVTSAVARNTFLSDGSYGWSGAYGTHFWIDPKEEIIGILMTQTPSREAQADFETAAMQTIATGAPSGAVSGTR